MQNTWNLVLCKPFDFKLFELYYFNITTDADSTYKQANMLYNGIMVIIIKKKLNALNEVTKDFF